MIEIHGLALSRGNKTLIENGYATIYPGEKVGLVGANGSGKSSLLGLLRKELQEDAGMVMIPSQWRISSVMQDLELSDKTAIQYVMEGDDRFAEISKKIEQATIENDFEAVALLHHEFELIDGYSAESRAGELLYGLAFSAEEQQMATRLFSGGWQMKLNLARALMKPCDLLLLDEPTNHLDMDAIYWLEKWLTRFEGTLILIAHDSVFLDRVINKVIAVEDCTLKMHKGNYTDFIEWQQQQKMAQQSAYEQQQKNIAHLKSFINRFKAKASKAKQAQSRMKMLDRMELIASVHESSAFQFQLLSGGNCPHPVMQLKDSMLGYDGTPILTKVSLHIEPGDRIGLLGVNGAGKSTLMKTLAGALDLIHGQRVAPSQLKIGYFNQHQVEQLDTDEDAFWHLKRIAPRADMTTLRAFLGQFGFSGDMVFEKVGSFSGGEKSRLVLALLAWEKPHLLLLDEPTNHLDLETREALAIALQSFEGAVIVVSHDRQLLCSVVDRFWLISEGRLAEYDGTLDDYAQKVLEDRRREQKKQLTKSEKPTKSTSNESHLKKLNEIEKRIKKVEEQLMKIEKKILTIDPVSAEATQLYSEQLQLQSELTQLEQEWLNQCD